MSQKDRGFSVCPGTVISFLCLLGCLAGFLRVEIKLSGYEDRLNSVEEKAITGDHGSSESYSNKGMMKASATRQKIGKK